MHLATACVLRRFELELDDDVVRERDVDVVRDCVIGLPPPESKGSDSKLSGRESIGSYLGRRIWLSHVE